MRKVPSSRAPECTVQKYIGSAFDEVKVVADEIDKVIYVADNLANADVIIPYLGDIELCADNLDVIKEAPVHAVTASNAAISATASESAATQAKDTAEAAKDIAIAKANEATNSATSASTDAANASASETNAQNSATAAAESAKKSEDIYEAFAKGAVYRGGWNPKTGVYPDALNINSYWDVYLDAGVPSLDFDGITWYSGDRLIYSVPDSKYFHITRVAGVLSVNGLSGAVNLQLSDLTGLLDLENKKADTNLVLRHSDVANYIPSASDIVEGEVLINTADKTIFTKDSTGAVISIGSGAGSGVPIYESKETSFTAESNNGYNVKLSLSAIKVTMPSNPSVGDTIYIKDYYGKASLVTPIVLSGLIEGSTEEIALTQGKVSLVLTYSDATIGWQIIDGIGEASQYQDLPYQEVVIVPAGAYQTGTWTLPDGMEWTDFERIEVNGTFATASYYTNGTTIVDKHDVNRNPENWAAGVFSTDSAGRFIEVTATGLSSLTISGYKATGALKSIVGYTKYKPVWDYEEAVGVAPIEILPWGKRQVSSPSYSVDFTLPDNMTWDDFEYIEVGMGIGDNPYVYRTDVITKEVLDYAKIENETLSEVVLIRPSWSDGHTNLTNYMFWVFRTSPTTGKYLTPDWSTGTYPRFMTGYAKRRPILATSQGASGSYTSSDGKTVTVVDGLIMSIV